MGSPRGARRITSTLAPLQKPISSRRRRRSSSPPTAKTLPREQMPSSFGQQVSGLTHWLQAAKSHAFCIGPSGGEGNADGRVRPGTILSLRLSFNSLYRRKPGALPGAAGSGRPDPKRHSRRRLSRSGGGTAAEDSRQGRQEAKSAKE